ncbi:hypothetical protein HBJ39_028595 (plasmid) [Klebsiella pneumoniae]|uniref:hypothetical protein n=1 Tax=Klebsiella pneumoniae TaxID=573 RepID=UPI001AE25369|nr:hypothetical protein [Klebsiella pneumoniae]QSI40031.1 hypothetical protein HBJ39_028595 [Klebsiella pneumoniae]
MNTKGPAVLGAFDNNGRVVGCSIKRYPHLEAFAEVRSDDRNDGVLREGSAASYFASGNRTD